MRHDGNHRFDKQSDLIAGMRPFEVSVSHEPVFETGVARYGGADGGDGFLEDLVDDGVGDGEVVFVVCEDKAERAVGFVEGHAVVGLPLALGMGMRLALGSVFSRFEGDARVDGGEELTLVFLGWRCCRLGW